MRFLVVLYRLLPLFLSLGRDRRRHLFWGAPAIRSLSFHQRRAKKLTSTLASLGPFFVKIGQVFSARPDIVPEPYLGSLASLTDSLPFVPFEHIEEELVQSYNQSYAKLFESIDIVPLAAGSLGQVYRARYQGQDVVIKVLRPGVEELIALDLSIATRLLDWLIPHFANRHLVGLRVVLTEFAKTIEGEMDFRQEAAHAIYFKQRFADNPKIVIPTIYPELTRQRVMVMEYISGVRVDSPLLLTIPGFSPARLIETIIEVYIHMMLVDGLFHADPHPGNLLVGPSGQVVLLDFGMVIPVNQTTRGHLAKTALAAVAKDASGVADGFFALGVVVPGTDHARIMRLVQILLDLAYRGVRPPEVLKTLTDDVLETLYDWPILLTGEMVYFSRAVALIEGLGIHLMPQFNVVKLTTPVILRHRRQIFAALGEIGPVKTPEAAWRDLFSDLIKVASGTEQSVRQAFTKHLPFLFSPEEMAAFASVATFFQALLPKNNQA